VPSMLPDSEEHHAEYSCGTNHHNYFALISMGHARLFQRIFLFMALWVFVLEYSLLVVSSPFLDVSLKLCGFLGVILMVRPRLINLQGATKISAILFSLWLVYPLVPGLLEGPKLGTLQWLKFLVMGSIFLVLMAAESSRQPLVLRAITRGYMVLGVIFAVQAIGGFIAMLFEIVTPSTVQIARRPMVLMANIGVFGWANALQFPVEGIQLLRPQGWFFEPSLLAAFLIPAVCFLWAEYQSGRSKAIYLALIVVAIAMFLTLSLAGWFGLLYAFMFLLWFRRVSAYLLRFTILTKQWCVSLIALVVLSLLFLMLAKGYMLSSNLLRQYALNSTTLGGFGEVIGRSFGRDEFGPSGNLVREHYAIKEYLMLFLHKPLGIGLGHTLGTHELQTSNAFFFWVMSSGLGVIFMLSFFLYGFLRYCSPLLQSNSVKERAIGAAMLGVAMHNLSYGNWVAPSFLILLSAVGIASTTLTRNVNFSSNEGS
jgi:hypothetical protein